MFKMERKGRFFELKVENKYCYLQEILISGPRCLRTYQLYTQNHLHWRGNYKDNSKYLNQFHRFNHF